MEALILASELFWQQKQYGAALQILNTLRMKLDVDGPDLENFSELRDKMKVTFMKWINTEEIKHLQYAKMPQPEEPGEFDLTHPYECIQAFTKIYVRAR